MHLDDLEQRLLRLQEQGLLRVPDDEPIRQAMEDHHGRGFLDLSSNDYLRLRQQGQGGVSRETRSSMGSNPTWEGTGGLFSGEAIQTGTAADWSAEPPHGEKVDEWQQSAKPAVVSRETKTQQLGITSNVSRETHGRQVDFGAGASRLIFGTDVTHLEVERQVAGWLRQPAALLFSSGYAANVGALGCLLSEGDVVFSDALNHASLIDGIRLGKAERMIVPHLDLQKLDKGLQGLAPSVRGRWVVVESYYSMDGDGPDLRELRRICDRYDAHLYVDEAHGMGVFGPHGAGRLAESETRADVVMAAFGKAVGCQGACVCGSWTLRTWLWNRARSFVFSTAPSPLLAQTLSQQIERTAQAEAERQHLANLGREFRRRAKDSGLPLSPSSFGPICSILVGAPEAAVGAAQQLRADGILCQAIRPPTVPEGHSRLRLTLHARLEKSDLDRTIRLLRRAILDSR